MSDRELARLFARTSKDLDARQRARIRQLKGLEHDLFEVMVRKILDTLDDGNGVIRTGRGSASINRLVDEVFRTMERSGLRDFYRASVSDLFSILGGVDSYNEALSETIGTTDKRFKAMRRSVDRLMRKRLGIDDEGRIQQEGFLSRTFDTNALRKEVMETVNAAANSGKPMNRLVRELEVTIKGTREVSGLLQRELSTFVFDTYQAFDRAANDAYAVKLGLNAFVYQGGLIETSREFCIKRNGKVFTVEEAEKEWPKDPTLPRTRKERQSGVLTGYNPTVDMGRWNCRHRTRYISPALAEQLRPDLKQKDI